jgi:DNA repair protein RadD
MSSDNPLASGSTQYSASLLALQGERSAPTLWPFQNDLLNNVRSTFKDGARSVVMVSATGSGKTVMFVSIVDGAMRRGRRFLVLVHRVELIEQTSAALVELGVPHGIIAPGYPATTELVQVASIQTLVRRLNQHSDYDFIVVDEAHHAREHGARWSMRCPMPRCWA